jgi:multidrug efflux pump subunit AcrA (membrane-fusion protein)
MKGKYVLIPAAILAVGFLIMMTLISMREEPSEIKASQQVRFVETREIKLETVNARIIAYGRLKSSQPVTLYSEVNGTLVRGDIPFKPAQSFNRNDLILKIDDRQIRLDINSLKSDFLNALASVLPEIKVDFPDEFAIWQDFFNSCDFEHTLPDLPPVNDQKIKLFLSRFNVYKLYYQVRNLEIQLEKHFFYAPFKGSIISADLRVGSTARPGTRLGEIVNLENLEVEVQVPAEDIGWIDPDGKVRFTSSEIPGSWEGRIKRIGNSIDEQTHTVAVFFEILNSNHEQLFENVFLKAEIPGKKIDQACSVPRKVIYNDEFVYIKKDGRLTKRPVNIVRRELDSVIVNGGLSSNDSLITDVLQGVAEGMLVRSKF